MRSSTVDGKHRHGLQAHPLLQAQRHLRARLLLRFVLYAGICGSRASIITWHPMECAARAKGAPSKLPPWHKVTRPIKYQSSDCMLGLSMSCQHGLKCSESFLHSFRSVTVQTSLQGGSSASSTKVSAKVPGSAGHGPCARRWRRQSKKAPQGPRIPEAKEGPPRPLHTPQITAGPSHAWLTNCTQLPHYPQHRENEEPQACVERLYDVQSQWP